MLKHPLLPIVVISALSVTGCNPGDSTNQGSDGGALTEVAEGEVVARVNGQPITEETLVMISEANRRANIPRDKLIDDLIKHELLYQEAMRKKLQDKPEVAQRLSFIRRSILSQAAMQDFIANTPIPDAEIQAEYEKTFGASAQEEYKARHILTKSEDTAKEVIQKLEEGGDFAALAQEYSTGPTGPKGGDLGWFEAKQMVAPFSEAVVALKNGEYTKAPVKTQFGWHVILREESRAKSPPPLDAMKANIQTQLQRKAIEKHLENLRGSAKIEIVPPKTAEPETGSLSAPPPVPAEQNPTAEKSEAAAEIIEVAEENAGSETAAEGDKAEDDSTTAEQESANPSDSARPASE